MGNYTAEPFAVTAMGHRCMPRDPKAAAWSAVGAVCHETSPERVKGVLSVGEVAMRYLTLATKVLVQDGPGSPGERYRDQFPGHDHALRLLDTASKLALIDAV